VVSLHGPRRLRPDRRGPLRGLAVAAVLAVVVGGVVRAAQDDDTAAPTGVVPGSGGFEPSVSSTAPTMGGSGPAVATTTTPATTADRAPSDTSATTSAPTPEAEGVVGAQAAAAQYLEVLATGDLDHAAPLVGEGSTAYANSFDGVEAMLVGEAQRWAAWSDVDPTISVIELGPGAAVVVYEAERLAPQALPVVRYVSAGGWVVEPFAFDPDSGSRFGPPLAPDDVDGDGVWEVSEADPLVLGAPQPIQVALPGAAPETLMGVDTEQGPAAIWVAPSGLQGPTTLVIARKADDSPVFVAEALRLEIAG
jgi:hypothetical protein